MAISRASAHSIWLVALTSLAGVSAFGNFGYQGPLYSPSDIGITSLDNATFVPTVHNSRTAWMVEFYSSWCGHCVHFAPIFKKIGIYVQNWSPVIKVGAIDCADEKNMPVCRDYEIMGYPTIKFFHPMSSTKNLGSESSTPKSVESVVYDMVNFLGDVERNSTFNQYTSKWPKLLPYMDSSLEDLWKKDGSAFQDGVAVVLLGSNKSPYPPKILLDASSLVANLDIPVVLQKIDVETMSPSLKAQFPTLPNIKASEADVRMYVVTQKGGRIQTPVDISPKEFGIANFLKALRSYFWDNSKNLSAMGNGSVRKEDKITVIKSNSNNNAHPAQMSHKESDIKRRRYTAHAADMEKAILYSISHEVAQHGMITGKSLNDLQDYIDVLVKLYPGSSETKRPRVTQFLSALRSWIMGHDDAIKGEELGKQVDKLRSQFGAFNDLPEEGWIGCRGSESRYGGYPCALWTLFHALTVNHASEDGGEHLSLDDKPTVVLEAMRGYISSFFGCRECARHFEQETENGKAFENIRNPQDAMLWLWKAHNRVNLRLSGDLTDDPVFPKEKWPNQQHCSDCYSNRVAGFDLWSEFKIKNVITFLREVYGRERLDFQGLDLSSSERDEFEDFETHDVGLPILTRDKEDQQHRQKDLRPKLRKGRISRPASLSRRTDYKINHKPTNDAGGNTSSSLYKFIASFTNSFMDRVNSFRTALDF